MKTFVFANQKGGCGKSATCVSLAMAFRQANVQVAILDLDERQLTSWVNGNAVGVPAFRKGEELPECQVLLIDTPGYLDAPELQAACAYVRDPVDGRVIVPMQANFTDFDATVRALGPLGLLDNPSARLLYTRVKRQSALAKQREKFSERIQLPVLKSMMTERQCYQSAVRLGWDRMTDDAIAELNALKTELLI